MITYAEVVLKLLERQDELKVAKEDVERAIAQIEVIEETSNELKQSIDDYQTNMEDLKQQYEDSVQKLQNDYDSASKHQQQNMKQEIFQRFEKFKSGFSSLKANFRSALEKDIIALEEKSKDMKIASINQRTMVMVLFEDFCDALFYHRFSQCKEDTVPAMSDRFDEILEKLNFIQWDSITTHDTLPFNPTTFNGKRIELQNDTILNFKLNRYICLKDITGYGR